MNVEQMKFYGFSLGNLFKGVAFGYRRVKRPGLYCVLIKHHWTLLYKRNKGKSYIFNSLKMENNKRDEKMVALSKNIQGEKPFCGLYCLVIASIINKFGLAAGLEYFSSFQSRNALQRSPNDLRIAEDFERFFYVTDVESELRTNSM